MDPRFHSRHKWDGYFWLTFWLYSLVIILFGFAPPVQERFFGQDPQPASIALQLHVWSFTAWMCLLAIQAFLASKHKMELHRFFGLAMLPLALAMLGSAGMSEIYSADRAIENGRELNFRATTFGVLIGFAVLIPFAWAKRTDPPAHKRLILLATATILAGAHFRIWGAWWSDEWFEASFLSRFLYFHGGTLILVGMGIAYDLISRKALHPVYKIALPIMLAWQLAVIFAYDSDWFDPLIRPLIEAF